MLISFFCPGVSSSTCENSPSPTFRERQTASRGQSTSLFQGSYDGQPSVTTATTLYQRRYPSLYSRSHSDLLQRGANQITPALRFVWPVLVRITEHLPNDFRVDHEDRPSPLNGGGDVRNGLEWHFLQQ